MSRKNVSAVVAVLLLVVAASLGYVSVRRVQRQILVGDLCDLTRNSEWDQALARGAGLSGSDGEGRIATECLCWAYAAKDRLDKCVKLVDQVLADPGAADWVPDITLTRLLLRDRTDSGRYADAVELARRALRVYPTDPQLLDAELVNRSVIEDEASVLTDMRRRLDDDLEQSVALRLVLSAGYERRGDYAGSLEVLGEQPPPSDTPAQKAWFEARTTALAGLQRREDLVKTYELWKSMGADPFDLRANYAIRISMFGLSDPEHSRTELLELAMKDEEKLTSDGMRRTLYERLIGHYLVEGRVEEALEVYDRATARLKNVTISREEILRSASSGRLSTLSKQDTHNALVFSAPADGPSGTLLASPEPDVAVDVDFPSYPLAAGGQVRVLRRPGPHPVRWVFRDEQRRAVASGTAWPDRGETQIQIRPGIPHEPQSFTPTLRPGDGRRRVFVVISDCEEWRLVQYLRARGELPVHEHLIKSGYSAVLTSTPAFTGAAMDSLVWPTRGRHITFLGMTNQLGIELGGLSSVGENPFDFLRSVLPEGENLFESIGAGPQVAANLLFSHGYINAGKNGELIGPNGEHRPVANLLALRPLTQEESKDLPLVMKQSRPYRAEVEKMAAELDSAVNLARAGLVDLLLIRIEPLDILTHTFYTEMMRSDQGDGRDTLLWAYRYIDTRLGQIWQALDADDVFILMSDHGIRTALEHEEQAIFVAVGAGVPRGRAPGSPHLRGVPHLLAQLFGQQTSWPDTKIARWAAALPARAEAAPAARP